MVELEAQLSRNYYGDEPRKRSMGREKGTHGIIISTPIDFWGYLIYQL